MLSHLTERNACTLSDRLHDVPAVTPALLQEVIDKSYTGDCPIDKALNAAFA